MRVSMDAVVAEGKLCEAAICYTGDILDPARAEIRSQILRRPGQGAGEGRRPHHRRQGHGRPAEAGRGARAVQGAARGDRPADPFPHARHVRALSAATVLAAVEAGVDAIDAAMDSLVRQHLAALPRLDRRGAEGHRARSRPRLRTGSARSPSTGKRCATSTRPSRAISRGRPRKSTCTKCRAASSPISRSRRARSGSRRAGTRWRRPMTTST